MYFLNYDFLNFIKARGPSGACSGPCRSRLHRVPTHALMQTQRQVRGLHIHALEDGVADQRGEAERLSGTESARQSDGASASGPQLETYGRIAFGAFGPNMAVVTSCGNSQLNGSGRRLWGVGWEPTPMPTQAGLGSWDLSKAKHKQNNSRKLDLWAVS